MGAQGCELLRRGREAVGFFKSQPFAIADDRAPLSHGCHGGEHGDEVGYVACAQGEADEVVGLRGRGTRAAAYACAEPREGGHDGAVALGRGKGEPRHGDVVGAHRAGAEPECGVRPITFDRELAGRAVGRPIEEVAGGLNVGNDLVFHLDTDAEGGECLKRDRDVGLAPRCARSRESRRVAPAAGRRA